MARDIPVGNGKLLVNFDRQYHIRDIYFPHVGKENHTDGHRFGLGVWVDGQFSWVHDSWQITQEYEEETLVSHVVLENQQLGLSILCRDTVDFHENVLVRQFVIRNALSGERRVRLFFHNDFHISETEVGDTAYYDPATKAIIHYKGPRWFLVNACREGEPAGLDQYAVGKKETAGAEGTWRDAEDGVLSGNAAVQGAVDSVGAVHCSIPSKGERVVYAWIAAGTDYDQVRLLDKLTREKGPQTLLHRTERYWRLWANVEPNDLGELPPEIRDAFKHSLLILRTQIDGNGGIMAGTDYDITSFARDTYAYVWTRDGSLVAYALDLAGYEGSTRPFFEFCSRVMDPGGYFLHKYTPQGNLASSWHPWIRDGERQLPVQEDETGLVLWALWHHFDKFHDLDFVKPFYRPIVIHAAEWMSSFRDANGLPQESYDLWEERIGVHAWTVAATWAGLKAASRFAAIFGETDLARKYASVADEMKQAADSHLWSEELGRFARSVTPVNDGYRVDAVVDASLCGLFLFGMYEVGDPRIVRTMEAIGEKLSVRTGVGGLARYEGDMYQRSVPAEDANVPGNPWFLSTLWLAQWHIARAQTPEELQPALEAITWVVKRALASGVLAEQVHPYTGEPLSVSPLTWSHSTFVQTVLEYVEKLSGFGRCGGCGQPLHERSEPVYVSRRLAVTMSPDEQAASRTQEERHQDEVRQASGCESTRDKAKV
jgi:glucoamylase